MSNYVQLTYFAPKDALPAGNPSKIIYGAQIDPEFSAISTAIATKFDPTTASIPNTLTFSGNLTFGGINTINGVPQTSPLTIVSNSVGTQADLGISRATTVANQLANGPNIQLSGESGQASILQNSGGQTELWQAEAGNWKQVWACGADYDFVFQTPLVAQSFFAANTAIQPQPAGFGLFTAHGAAGTATGNRGWFGFNVGFDGSNWRTGADGSSNGGVLVTGNYNPALFSVIPIPDTGGTSQTIADASVEQNLAQFQVRPGAVTGVGASSGAQVDMTPDSFSGLVAIGGCSGSPSAAIQLYKIGKVVYLHVGASSFGNSNASFLNITIPTAFSPISVPMHIGYMPNTAFIDNGTPQTPNDVQGVFDSVGLLTFWRNGVEDNWTTTGDKGINLNATMSWMIA